jgi:methyl-accepting chemotaxis protein
VNQAIGQMDQVTQQNAALVEEAAAAAGSLQDQAGKLAQVVSVFKMNGMDAPRVGTSLAMVQTARMPAKVVAPKLARKAQPPKALPSSLAKPKRASAKSDVSEEWEQF